MSGVCQEHGRFDERIVRNAKDIDICFQELRAQREAMQTQQRSIDKLHNDRLWMAGILSFVMLFVAPVWTRFVNNVLMPAAPTAAVHVPVPIQEPRP